MTNLNILLMLGTLIVIDTLTLMLAAVQKGMRNVSTSFYALGAVVLALLVSEMLYYSAQSPAMAAWLFNLKVPLVSFASVAMLVLILRYYRLDRLITAGRVLLLCVVPAITAVMALTSPWHPLLRQTLEVVQLQPVHIVANVRGVWFWVHAAYTYLLTLGGVVVIAVQHQKLPRGYRSPSFVLSSALALIVAVNLVSIFFSLPFDITVVGMAVALVFVYISIASSSKSDLLEIAREEIYNSMDEALFIRNPNGQVVHANPAARRWLRQLGIELDFPFRFEYIFTVLRRHGATIRDDGEAGTDIYYSVEDRGVVYNLRERFVYDKGGREIGVFSTLLDVTQYKQVIERLQKTVDIDALTGLANRRVFEAQKQEHDQAGTMPLSVILGDANGLKRVNDQLGHDQGDALLRILAGQMRQCCPGDGTVARIGGDEFAIVLPGRGEEAVAELIRCIQQGLAGRAGENPFEASVALGAATRRLGEDGRPEPMDELARRADEAMYRDKRYDRRASGRR